MSRKIVNTMDKKLSPSLEARRQQSELHLIEICVRAALLNARNSLLNATRELINALRASPSSSDYTQADLERMPKHLREAIQPLLDEVSYLSAKIEASEYAGLAECAAKPLPIRDLAPKTNEFSRYDHNGNLISKTLAGRGMELDPSRRTLKTNGRHVHLTRKEFDVLHYLIQHTGIPVAHAELLQAVWGKEYAQERQYLRVIIRQLRRKVEHNPSKPEYLLTNAAIGYEFSQPDVAAKE